jgi:transcriptional regulator with XRE-family HTH domain
VNKSLIFNRIEKARKNARIPKMEFYNAIGMSGTGFLQMQENDSIKVTMLQKIADVLNVPVSSFFDESPANTGKNAGGGHGDLETLEPWDESATADLMQKYKGLPDAEIIKLLRHNISLLQMELDMIKTLADVQAKKIVELHKNNLPG